MERIRKSAREVFTDLAELQTAGILPTRAKRLADLEEKVKDQGEMMALMSAEYGKNIVNLIKLRGDL